MFTDDERHVIDLTVELTNSFAALPSGTSGRYKYFGDGD